MSGAGFIHLRVHSDHSILEGRMTAKEIVKAVAADGMPAVAVTNHNNMFNALEFSVEAPGAGVQPIMGCAVDVASADGGGSLVLLAQGEEGWRTLCALSERMWMRPHNGSPEIFMADLEEMNGGLICLSGGAYGPAGNMILRDRADMAREWTSRMSDIFPQRLYVEIQRHPDEDGWLTTEEERTEGEILQIAYDLNLPIAASNDARFLKAEDFEAMDAMICIGDKTAVADPDRRRHTPSHALLPAERMREIFEDLPEACDRTLEIAARCAYKVPKLDPILPRFAEDEVEELRRQSREGLRRRLEVIPHAVSLKEYEDRLEFELKIIEQMGFPGYFLIVADFIKWAKDNDIPVGPGRGSGAGSLVAYSLTITDLDPLRYSLLFERFLNPERVSMPDFDIDFCMDRREEVIDYVSHKYGEDRVGQIITFGGLLSKAAIRDVGRVMGLAFGQTDRLSKLIPVKGVKPVSIEEAMRTEPRLVEIANRDDRVKDALAVAEKVEDSGFRSAGTHAAGVVIADRPLRDLVPVYRDVKSSMPATQFNMGWVEKAGLVKFDFLGLKTLTVIKKTLDYVEAGGWGKVDISLIPVDDKASYELMAAAETVSVFQIESPGMMDALRRMRPTRIEDIIALVALYRPGPMENIPAYCEVKNGLRDITSIHPTIDPILEETQGIIVYQEQVMQIAQVMAGYTLGGADLLRRAMGKKKPEEMAKERPKFIDGCAATHGVDPEKAGEVFDLLEKFANYGFNKSHAAAYALISYQTAWLKTHYPVEFMAAIMSCDADNTDKLAKARGEMVRMGIDIASPDVNLSGVDFRVEDGSVRYALSALKNAGETAVSVLVAERDANGPFTSMENMAGRVDLGAVGRKALESMARAGAFDSLVPDRAEALALCVPAMAMSKDIFQSRKEGSKKAVGDLFSDMEHGSKMSVKLRPAPFRKWSHQERMSEELSAVGFHLSGHPLDDRIDELRRSGISSIGSIPEIVRVGKANITLAGVVVSYEEKPTKTGKKFGIVTLSDPGGVMELQCFADNLPDIRKVCEPGAIVVLNTRVSTDGETIRGNVMGAQTVDQMLSTHAPRDVWIYVDTLPAVAKVADTFRANLPLPGKSSVHMIVPDNAGGRVVLRVMDDVLIGSRANQDLSAIPGVTVKMTEKGTRPTDLQIEEPQTKAEADAEEMEPA